MSDTLLAIQTFLEKRLDLSADKITSDSTLESLQIDSLLLLELVFELEDQLGVRLPENTSTPRTVGDLIKTITRIQQKPVNSAL